MILLDTHALVWWCNGDPRLSGRARRAIDDERKFDEVAASSFSCWEIAILVQNNRLDLSASVSDWLATVMQFRAIRFIAVNNEIAVASVQLPGNIHKDPADRIIVATARSLGVPIVTADRQLRAYTHVTTIW